MAQALVRAASPLVATPPEWQGFAEPAKHPDESGCGTYEYVRHKPSGACRRLLVAWKACRSSYGSPDCARHSVGLRRWGGGLGRRGRRRLKMEEEFDSARHRDAITQCRPKSPVAGCLDRRMVQMRFHAMGEGHAGDVPFGIEIDVHRDVPASATVSGAQWVCRLLLLQHCRRRDTRGERRCCLACVCQGLGRGQGPNCKQQARPALEPM